MACNVYESAKPFNTSKGKQKHTRPIHIQLRKRKRTISHSDTDPLCLSTGTGDSLQGTKMELTPLNIEPIPEPINPRDPLNLDSCPNNKKKKTNKSVCVSLHNDEDSKGVEPMETPVPAGQPDVAVAKNKPVYIYGNYPSYYGYRNAEFSKDPRIEFFKSEMFANKKCLDIGCNSGAITIKIARDFTPLFIQGIDIDPELVKKARKSLKYSLGRNNGGYPISLYGSVTEDRPGIGKFPQNISFRTENYVLSPDQLIGYAPEGSYDVILCLSVTKWVHLNWGDEGVKRLFRRIYKDLSEDGVLLLECQGISGYAKRSKLSPHMRDHFKSLEFRPDTFEQFLLSEVGFRSSEVLGTPAHGSKGFQRQMEVFRKGTLHS